jgi:BirA family biotin operon repressor/biotin-[acetyl-CoA-carboxylase] ligase
MFISETLRQLVVLLADGRFHSGTELASALGLSRSAIWKQLQALHELGLELTAVSGKGYKLQQPLQLLEKTQIYTYLSAQAAELLRSLEIHDVIASTNSYLFELAAQSGESGQVCLAEYQSAGKGRRGRVWVSPYGHNIYLSILWRYQDGPAALAGLSLALGVAVIRALHAFGLTEVGLKWPNDIYWRQRKLAGILVEVSGENGGPCHAVVGLGVNFYLSQQQAAAIDQPWVDISSALGAGAYARRNECIALLLNELLPIVADFRAGSIQKYVAEWRSYDCMLGKTVDVFIGAYRQTGVVTGIDAAGLLLLQMPDGQVQHFASGEVSLSSA